MNFRDKAIIDGIYEPHMVPKPLIPVSDAAGTVVEIGTAVTKFKIGDRVLSKHGGTKEMMGTWYKYSIYLPSLV